MSSGRLGPRLPTVAPIFGTSAKPPPLFIASSVGPSGSTTPSGSLPVAIWDAWVAPV